MFTLIDDNITEFGDLVSVEIATAIGDNINYFLDSMPVGSIIPIITSIPGIPTPDANIWQLCDGSTITHPNSPIRNTSVPQLGQDGLYLKMYDSIGQVGSYGGQNVFDLTHNHGGQTGDNDAYPTDGDTDDDFFTAKSHHHSIGNDLGIYNIDPTHIRISHFMKINETGMASSSRFRDLEKDFATTIAQALWQKASRAINAFDKCYPVGTLMFFFSTQSNLPGPPDVNHWQFLNGGTVTNPNSPIFGHTLPDFSNFLIKHPGSSQSDLSIGGTTTISTSHNHGGATGSTDDRDEFQLDNGGERQEAGGHTHPISGDLGFFNVIPPYVQLQCYIRIV